MTERRATPMGTTFKGMMMSKQTRTAGWYLVKHAFNTFCVDFFDGAAWFLSHDKHGHGGTAISVSDKAVVGPMTLMTDATSCPENASDATKPTTKKAAKRRQSVPSK